jgi:hypothetical protein
LLCIKLARFIVPPDIFLSISVRRQGESRRQRKLYVDGLPNSYARSGGGIQQELARN